VTDEGLLLAVEVHEVGRGDRAVAKLGLTSRIESAWLEALFPDRITSQTQMRWNETNQAAEQVTERLFDALVIDETVRPAADAAEAETMIVERIMAGELRLNRWDDAVEQWLARVRCVATWRPELQLTTYTDDDLRVILHELVDGARRFAEVADRPVLDKLRWALSWDHQQVVERLAPSKFKLPGGYAMPITYAPDAPPRGRAKIQQLYDQADTPRINEGRTPIVLEILAPNHRPVAVTDDLASFWANTYPQVKKELKRRYAKHQWR